MDSSETSTFQHRVVRIIAILGIVLAANGFAMLAFSVLYTLQNSSVTIIGWSDSPWTGIAFSTYALLTIGSVGLLRWKPWGRLCMLLWCIAHVLMHVSTQVYFLSFLFRATGGTVQSTQPGPGYHITFSLLGIASDVVYPVAVLVILNLKEVRHLWARRARSGFEVLPVQPLEVT